MKSIAFAIVGCFLASGCGCARERHQAHRRGTQLLIVYNVNRQPLAGTFLYKSPTEPYASDGSSCCLVIDGKGRAIAWRDPNQPFDQITRTIGTRRLNRLYRQVSEAGMDRFARPVSIRQEAIDTLRQIRPDRLRVLPSGTEIAGATDASYFTVGLGTRVTDLDPAKDDQTLAAVRRTLRIMRPIYDEVLEKGRPEKIDYVRHVYWDGHQSIGRGETVECIVVADGHFAAWGWGVAGKRSAGEPVCAHTQALLLAQLTRAGLFDLEPLATAPSKTMYSSVTTVEARIDGREIRAVATPAITGILTRFRRNMQDASDR